MKILGIDPGLRMTGYGLIEYRPLQPTQPHLLDGGVIRLKTNTSLADRLTELAAELNALLDESPPDICAVEQLYAHYKHPRTAILMGHARGVILQTAATRGIRIAEFAANRIKQSVTGHGHAPKAQMQRAVQVLFKLAEPPSPPDVADALAIAICCGQSLVGRRITHH